MWYGHICRQKSVKIWQGAFLKIKTTSRKVTELNSNVTKLFTKKSHVTDLKWSEMKMWVQNWENPWFYIRLLIYVHILSPKYFTYTIWTWIDWNQWLMSQKSKNLDVIEGHPSYMMTESEVDLNGCNYIWKLKFIKERTIIIN